MKQFTVIVYWVILLVLLSVPAAAADLGIGIGWYEPSTDTQGKPLNDLKSTEIQYYVNAGGVDGPATFGASIPASSPQGGQWMTTTISIPGYMSPGLPPWVYVAIILYETDTQGRWSEPSTSVLQIPAP